MRKKKTGTKKRTRTGESAAERIGFTGKELNPPFSPGFVARRRRRVHEPEIRSWPRSGLLNLGRPFKAGIGVAMDGASRQRRLNSTVADATGYLLDAQIRALKGPAKFIPAATRPTFWI